MLIKDLPEDIKRIAIQRTIEYRNNRTGIKFDIEIEDSSISYAFAWSETIEGKSNGLLWSNVDSGKYEKFYEFHKTNNKNNLLNFNQY